MTETREMEKKGESVVTIVMPCLNEALTLPLCITEAFAALSTLGVSGEVLIADNGSTDGSQEIAQRLGARVVPVSEVGYGSALRHGLLAVQSKYAVYADCDGSYDFGEVVRLISELRNGMDMVIGCRMPSAGGTIEIGAMPWLHRYLGTPILTFLCRIFYGIAINDINSGMRAVRLSTFRELILLSTGMEFSTEIILQMSAKGARMSQVPITLRRDKRNRLPHLQTWRDGWRHLCILLIYSPSILFIMPGAILSLLGASLLVLLTPGAFMFGSVQLSNNTRIVSSLVTLVGTQIFLLGLLASYVGQVCGIRKLNELFMRNYKSFFFVYAVPLGVGLLFFGIAVVVNTFVEWSHTGFSAFLFAHADRMLAPAATIGIFGLQLIASAFFSLFLSMIHRD